MSKTLYAAAALALFVAPAIAGSVTIDGMTPSLGGDRLLKRVVVKFDDLNPADAKGAAALYERINLAAVKLCTSNLGGANALLADKVEKCRAQAVREAVRSVDTPELTAAAAAAAATK